MRSLILHETRRFTLTSYGSGLAYALERKLTRESFLVQGDDAHDFRDELAKLTAPRLKMSYDDALGVLWNDYQEVAVVPEPKDYGDAAFVLCAACGRDAADCFVDPCATAILTDRLGL